MKKVTIRNFKDNPGLEFTGIKIGSTGELIEYKTHLGQGTALINNRKVYISRENVCQDVTEEILASICDTDERHNIDLTIIDIFTGEKLELLGSIEMDIEATYQRETYWQSEDVSSQSATLDADLKLLKDDGLIDIDFSFNEERICDLYKI